MPTPSRATFDVFFATLQGLLEAYKPTYTGERYKFDDYRGGTFGYSNPCVFVDQVLQRRTAVETWALTHSRAKKWFQDFRSTFDPDYPDYYFEGLDAVQTALRQLLNTLHPPDGQLPASLTVPRTVRVVLDVVVDEKHPDPLFVGCTLVDMIKAQPHPSWLVNGDVRLVTSKKNPYFTRH